MKKFHLRKSILEKRRELLSNDVKYKSKIISKIFFESEMYINAHSIMTYVSYRNEVITKYIIQRCIEDKKIVSIPITNTKSKVLTPSVLKDYDKELTQGTYGILEPKQEYIRPINPLSIDLILIPGSVFSNSGHRIGYGGGYYDRFLIRTKETALKIGLAYKFQLLDTIPYDKHDIPMDYIITEDGIVLCN